MARSLKTAAVLILLLAPFASTPAQDDIAAAESAAKANAESAEGSKYGEALGAAFGREHGGTIQACARQGKRADLVDFDLFLRISEAGKVDEALARPANAITTCVRDKLVGWKVSTPPHPGFWVKVAVKLKSK